MRSNRKTLMIMMTVAICLTVVLLISGKKYKDRIVLSEQRNVELTQQLQEEYARTEEIQELQEYMQSDEYKEKVAKEKLGLIKDGEIIFRESE